VGKESIEEGQRKKEGNDGVRVILKEPKGNRRVNRDAVKELLPYSSRDTLRGENVKEDEEKSMGERE